MTRSRRWPAGGVPGRGPSGGDARLPMADGRRPGRPAAGLVLDMLYVLDMRAARAAARVGNSGVEVGEARPVDKNPQ